MGFRAAGEYPKSLKPVQPELLVSSPLSRALHTADLAFQDADVPRLVLPLARERLWLSSDVGQPRRAPVLCT